MISSNVARSFTVPVLVLLALVLPQLSRADAVYTFNSTGLTYSNGTIGPWSWSFRGPDFITSNMDLNPSDLISVSNPTGDHIYGVEILNPTSSIFDVVTFIHVPEGMILDYRFAGPIDHFGTYSSGTATLVVSPVPEPSSLLLLGSGVIGAIGVMRRRFSC